MRKKTEADIDIVLKNEQGDFKKIFCKFIIEHYLRSFVRCFYLHSTHLLTFIHLNTAYPQAGKSWASGDQASDLERKHEKKFTWLKKLMSKIRRRQRYDGAEIC